MHQTTIEMKSFSKYHNLIKDISVQKKMTRPGVISFLDETPFLLLSHSLVSWKIENEFFLFNYEKIFQISLQQ